MTTEPAGTGRTVPDVTDAALDQAVATALELAVVVARVSAQLRPPVPVPKALRPIIRFAKLPPSARPAVRRLIDEDDEFRARVALVAEEAEVRRPAWLFLHRPDGWREELTALTRELRDVEEETQADRTDRSLQRKLAGAEAALARAEETATAARLEAARATGELGAERRMRRDAEDLADALGRRVASLEGERESALRRVDERAAEVEALRAELVGAGAEVAASRAKYAAAGRELAAARDALVGAEEAAARHARRSGDVSAALADAATAAAALGRALAVAGAAAEEPADFPTRGAPRQEDDRVTDRAAAGPAAPPRGPTLSRAARAARGRVGRPRVPEPLPPAIYDDSPEAAQHLMRVPGMLVLVDGYNATLTAWRHLPVNVQRSRLIDACGELSARSGAEILIVFDGTEDQGDVGAGSAQHVRRRVRWRFTQRDVEADDVLLDLVEDLDPIRPATVASSDRRVRDGARALGANAISTPQLFAALRRDLTRGGGAPE